MIELDVMAKDGEVSGKKLFEKSKILMYKYEGQRVCINQTCQEEILRINE